MSDLESEYYISERDCCLSLWTSLPPRGSSVSSYEDYILGRSKEDWARVIMTLTRFYTYKSKINSIVWGSQFKTIPGEYKGDLKTIVDIYNSESERKRRDEVGIEYIEHYLVFQYNSMYWIAYVTPFIDNEYRESEIIKITEEEAYKLALLFSTNENGFGDMNHLL
jgi:hypothetical protein